MLTESTHSAKRITLDDIAREVGLSRAAVGKVLGSNSSNIRVGKEKAELVRLAAVRMNYTPNINARALAGQASGVIGVLMDSQAPGVYLRRAAAIEREASRCGYRTMIGETHDDADNFYKTYVHMLQHGVDGILCLSHDYPPENHKIDHYFSACGPLVFLGGPERRGHSHVIQESDTGIRLAVAHLRERGRKRIALMSHVESRYWSVKARERGYFEAIPEECERILYPFRQSDNVPEMRENIRALIRNSIVPGGVDAVLTPNDLVALLMEGELLAAGLRIPEDIALVGFDNEIFSACAPIPLTTVDQNNGAIAAYAISMLLDIIQDKSGCHAARRISVRPELVIRQTT